MATGSYVYRDQYYGQRLILNVSRSGNTVKWSLQLQSTGSMQATIPWSISGATSKSGSGSVNQYSAFTSQIASGSFSRSAAGTITASATMFWGGVPTVSASFGAAGSPPRAPSNLKFTRTGNTTITLNFTKGSGATTTYFQASKNSNDWYALTSTTGSSKNVTGVGVNCYWRFRAYSNNSIGNSAYSNTVFLYTKPTTPQTPTLSANKRVDWVSNARYPHGFEIQRQDNGVDKGTYTVTGRSTRTWTDPNSQTPLTRYRVRSYAGESDNNTRAWSDWSNWSDTLMMLNYTPPRTSTINVIRVDANRNIDELGTYIRVVSKGFSSSVKDGTTELNKLWRRIEWREKGSTGSWSIQWVVGNATTGGTPSNWSTTVYSTSGAFAADKSYEIREGVKDSFTTAWQYVYFELPVAQIALSLSSTGAGVGKIIERGVLDVGGDAYISADAHIGGNLHLADPNVIVIDGVAYQRSGALSVTTGAGTASSPLWYWIYKPTMPYAPPAGWRFQFVAAGLRINFAWVAGMEYETTATPNVYIAMGGAAARSVTINWFLVKVS